jgi:hypothetical protein
VGSGRSYYEEKTRPTVAVAGRAQKPDEEKERENLTGKTDGRRMSSGFALVKIGENFRVR